MQISNYFIESKPKIDDEVSDKNKESTVGGDVALRSETLNKVEDNAYEQDPLLLLLPHGERYNLLRHLETYKPNDVILYHSDLVTLRILEVYKACHPEHELRIYVLMCRESNEEERYLCSLRQEQLAFEHLIREQGTLMTPREYDTSREPPPKLQLAKSTRCCGGGTDVSEAPRERNLCWKLLQIIIDMREFNSELPTVLYKRGVDIVPATLEVGDYILTPEIALERKAHDDLSQSLHSGRVFKQVEQMLRTYKRAILLIEANKKASYREINGGPFQGELSRRCRETRYLFTVLIRSYPALNIVWSLDPTYSSELFEELKFNQLNPNLEQALAVKCDSDTMNKDSDTNTSLKFTDQTSEDTDAPTGDLEKPHVNTVLQRQLCRLPNVSVGDVTEMMKSKYAGCLLDVINADSTTINQIFDYNPTLGQNLHCFFTTNFQTESIAP
uniref:DNA repair endonuclease XPF n=1 Tax=Syphacia muris TaxID=451379 RepID=A0A0N5ARY5_9BILA